MENIVLTIHLIIALLLIAIVLMQKSEGAALLSGGGNTQARPKANGLTKLTWALAAAFIVTSIALTILATRGGSTGSVVDSLMPPTTSQSAPAAPAAPGADLLPPMPSTNSEAPANQTSNP